MTTKIKQSILGDNNILIRGDVTPREPDVGWPGSAEAEQVSILTPKGETVDITELIYSIVARGSEVWDYLSQSLAESE